jgi:hypothetical protein
MRVIIDNGNKVGIIHNIELQPLTIGIDISTQLSLPRIWYLLVNTASNTAGTIVGTRKTLLIAGLLVGAGGLGGASGSLVQDVGLVDGVLVVGFCERR